MYVNRECLLKGFLTWQVPLSDLHESFNLAKPPFARDAVTFYACDYQEITGRCGARLPSQTVSLLPIIMIHTHLPRHIPTTYTILRPLNAFKQASLTDKKFFNIWSLRK